MSRSITEHLVEMQAWSLDNLPVGIETTSVTFAVALQSLFDRHFTGSVVVHFKDGRPQVLDLPPPKIRLVP